MSAKIAQQNIEQNIEQNNEQNIDELTTKQKVATPANWKQKDEVIVIPAVSDDEAKELFGDIRKVKPYLRYTKID